MSSPRIEMGMMAGIAIQDDFDVVPSSGFRIPIVNHVIPTMYIGKDQATDNNIITFCTTTDILNAPHWQKMIFNQRCYITLAVFGKTEHIVHKNCRVVKFDVHIQKNDPIVIAFSIAIPDKSIIDDGNIEWNNIHTEQSGAEVMDSIMSIYRLDNSTSSNNSIDVMPEVIVLEYIWGKQCYFNGRLVDTEKPTVNIGIVVGGLEDRLLHLANSFCDLCCTVIQNKSMINIYAPRAYATSIKIDSLNLNSELYTAINVVGSECSITTTRE